MGSSLATHAVGSLSTKVGGARSMEKVRAAKGHSSPATEEKLPQPTVLRAKSRRTLRRFNQIDRRI